MSPGSGDWANLDADSMGEESEQRSRATELMGLAVATAVVGGEPATEIVLDVLVLPAGPLPAERIIVPLPDSVLDRLVAARADRDKLRARA